MERSLIGCIALLTLCLHVAPLATEAQPPTKARRIGVVYLGFPDPEGTSTPLGLHGEAFLHGLRELGYVEGQNLTIEWRFAEESRERLAALVAELIQLPVEALVAVGTPTTQVAKQASTTIPIIQVTGDDPVAMGFVTSLARPGGNVTGLPSVPGPSLGKVLELLQAAVAGVSRVAVLVTPGSRSFWLRGTEEEAHTLGLQLHVLEGHEPQEFERAFATIVGQGIEAVVVPLSPIVYRYRTQIVELATKNRLPIIATDRSFASAGALLTYGVKLPALYQRAGIYVGKILHGTKPADLPVEQPMQFELVLNLKTAKALGLTIPPPLLLLADEVIH